MKNLNINKMNKYLFIIVMVLISSSCIDFLEWGLDELPLNDEAEIQTFFFEYRFTVVNENGFPQVEFRTMETAVTKDNTNINCVVTVPGPSGFFTEQVAAGVNLTNLVGYCTLSPAAVIEPMDNAPRLGGVGNWSQSPYRYKVTAADGSTKTWTITVSMAQ